MASTVQFPRDAAPALHRHFLSSGLWKTVRAQERARSDLAVESRRKSELVRPVASVKRLRDILDVAFAASLMEEEGRSIRFALGYLSPEGAALDFKVFPFKEPVALAPARLAKVAFATDPATTTLGVWPGPNGRLQVWGLIHHGDHTFAIDLKHQPTHLAVRVLRPGTFTVHFDGSLALLFARDHFHLFTARFDLLGTLRDQAGIEPVVAEALCRIARRMLAHGHGGALLISDARPLPKGLKLHPAFTTKTGLSLLKDAVAAYERSGTEPGKADAKAVYERFRLEEQHDEALSFVAQLTAVDGAVVMRTDLGVLGFGATIATPPRSAPDSVSVEDPRERKTRRVTLDKIGGNRHRSAVCFCAQQKTLALALVASQDGDLSLIGRTSKGGVHIIRPFELGVGI